MFYLVDSEKAKKEISSDCDYNSHLTKHYVEGVLSFEGSIEEGLKESVIEDSINNYKLITKHISEGIYAVNKDENVLNILSKYIDKIGVIVTNGEDNIGLPYTLGENIIVPCGYHHPPGPLGYVNPHLLVHEAWHIISRNNENLRDAAYNSLGFEKVEGLSVVEELSKIGYGEEEYFINPDAINNNYLYKLDNGEYILPFLGRNMSSSCLLFDKNKNVKELKDLREFPEYVKDFKIGYNSSVEEICAELFRAGVLNIESIKFGVKKSDNFYKAIDFSKSVNKNIFKLK